MHLRSKLTPEISEVDNLDGKMIQNVHFNFFPLRKTTTETKQDTLLNFSITEIPANLLHLRLKMTSEICQKLSSLFYLILGIMFTVRTHTD